MKPFRLNLGDRFARPFESGYAIMRRCLIANPGVPMSTILANRRESSRVRTAPSPVWPGVDHNHVPDLLPSSLDAHIGWQCPKCAINLYHSDIFALPWLSHCPVHHCAFTKYCPVCEQPWPTVIEMAKRHCRGCGRVSWSDLRAVQMDINYQPMADIVRFLSDRDVPISLLGRRGLHWLGWGPHWWREIHPFSALFATVQAHRYRRFSATELDALHVTRPALRRRSGYLITAKPEPQYDSEWGENGRYDFQLAEPQPARLIDDFRIMRYLVAWVDRGLRHRVHIGDYRYRKHGGFVEGCDACPYCMALSLWFYDVAAHHYGPYCVEHISKYPFADVGGFDGFFPVTEPFLQDEKQRVFFMDEAFTAWFYRRGLELLFVGLIRFAFDFLGIVRKWRDERCIVGGINSLLSYQDSKDDECAISCIKDRFTFYYENEHPLTSYIPPKLDNGDERCRAFHTQGIPWSCRSDRPSFSFSTANFTYRTFNALHEHFRHFLRDVFPE